jgi:hypothetical protein
MRHVSSHGKMIFAVVKICWYHQSAPQQNVNLFLSSQPTFHHLYIHHGCQFFLPSCWELCSPWCLDCVLIFVLSLVCSSLSSCLHIGPCTYYGADLVFLFSCWALGSLWCSLLFFCLHSRPCANAISLLFLP